MTPEAFVCSRCSIRYPVVAGIPDYRIAPDPWIDAEADRMLQTYWTMTQGKPRQQAERCMTHVMRAERRSRQ